jgi:cobalt-precorrin 5A hydrolase
MNNLAIVALTANGLELGRCLAESLGYGEVMAVAESARTKLQELFQAGRPLVCIMALGIVVRILGPVTKDKKTEPPVVVLDEAGRFAISVLGGHEGGANELANQVANAIGAIPVITTASEAFGFVLGVGCRRGVPCEEIEALFQELCKTRGLPASCLREVATVSLKADEPGLREFSNQHGVPLRCFTIEELSEVTDLPTPSAQVRAKIGINGVAEPAAMLAAGSSTLLVPKFRGKRVTMALARKENP